MQSTVLRTVYDCWSKHKQVRVMCLCPLIVYTCLDARNARGQADENAHCGADQRCDLGVLWRHEERIQSVLSFGEAFFLLLYMVGQIFYFVHIEPTSFYATPRKPKCLQLYPFFSSLWIWQVLNTAIYRLDCHTSNMEQELDDLKLQASRQEKFGVGFFTISP